MSYDAVRTGSLKLKGVKVKKHKRKSETPAEGAGGGVDALRYGMWWLVRKDEDMVGTVFVEAEHGGFLSSFDDGTLGEVPPPEARGDEAEEGASGSAAREKGDAEPVHPQPEDVFSFVRVSENRVALKTAFGRYVSCDEFGTVNARVEAMGTRELWQPIWKDQEAGALVFRSNSKGYLSCVPEAGVKAKAETQTMDDATMFRVWACADRQAKKAKSDLVEDRVTSLRAVEEDYVKKFQAGKVRLSTADSKALKHARSDGTLHVALLDRREKTKADKYCK